jgi:hypothetical protein
MKTSIALAVFGTLAFACIPAFSAERACRPSLSNAYHCPDKSKPASRPSASPSKTTNPTSDRPCRPSLSNLWTCPEASKARQRTVRASRPCRPSLSNGYRCPDSSTESGRPTKPTRTTAAPRRGCRPSLSNGFKCPPEGQADENQYNTERQAWTHCLTDTVVWANTQSNIYHFRGNHYYGTTVAGAYMCEQDAIAEGMRAAKNETHP